MKFEKHKAWFYYEGKKIAIAVVHPGRKNLTPGTFNSIAKGLKISQEQMVELLKCPFGYREYLKAQHLE